MTEIGICTDLEFAREIKIAGADYIELKAYEVALANDEEFCNIKQKLEQAKIPCRAMNFFFPPDWRVIGKNVNEKEVLEYIEKLFLRGKELGVKVLVVGSSKPRSIPEGYPIQSAKKQFARYLSFTGEMAEKLNMEAVIEPIRPSSSNFINSIGEAVEICRMVAHPRVHVMGDYYQMQEVGDNAEVILENALYVRHLHTIDIDTKRYPTNPNDEKQISLIDAYLDAYPDGRISIEGADFTDIETAKAACDALHKIAEQSENARKNREWTATISDIAKAADVSLGTVSNVLNNPQKVTPWKRELVMHAAKRYNYQPNQAARILKNKNSKTIGLLVPDISNPFYAELARGAEDTANQYGYTIFLCNNDRDASKEEQYLVSLHRKKVDGVIIVKPAIVADTIFQYFGVNNTVLIDSEEIEYFGKKLQVVNLDDEYGAHMVVQYFFENGHKNIAHISGALETPSSRRRSKIFTDFMKSMGTDTKDIIIEDGAYTYSGGRDAMRRILSRGSKVTAIFAANDLMAMGAINAIRESGLSVPNDISVIGYDDIEATEFCLPKLTTVHQAKYEIGQHGMHILFNSLGEKINIKESAIPRSEIIVRNSVRSILE